MNDGEDLEIFDPEATWKRKKVYNFHARELQVPVFRNGELVYQLPTLNEIRSTAASRSTRSGTRSSDLTIRTPTMWTSLRSSGRSNTVC